MSDRQRVIRRLVEQVVAAVPGESELTIRWAGVDSSYHQLVRPVGAANIWPTMAGPLIRIDEPRQVGLTLAGGAARLNDEGFRPPKRAPGITQGMATCLLAQRRRSGPRPPALADRQLLDAHEWLLVGPGLLARSQHRPGTWCGINRVQECRALRIVRVLIPWMRVQPATTFEAVWRATAGVTPKWGCVTSAVA
jgi:hypothetical protein